MLHETKHENYIVLSISKFKDILNKEAGKEVTCELNTGKQFLKTDSTTLYIGEENTNPTLVVCISQIEYTRIIQLNRELLMSMRSFLSVPLDLNTFPRFFVRRTKSLLTASFRFHFTIDTLAVRLYTSSLPRRVRDLHPLERAHGAQTKKTAISFHSQLSLSIILFIINNQFTKHINRNN